MSYKKSAKDLQRKTTENDDSVLQIDTTMYIECDELHKKNATNEETVVNIDETLHDHVKGGTRFISSCAGQYHVLPTTVVYFLQGNRSENRPVFVPNSRYRFVKLVCILVFFMIVCTASINTIVFCWEPLRVFTRRWSILFLVGGTVLVFGLNYAMACSACRVMPMNIICLVLVVIGMTSICIAVTGRYDTPIVFLAVISTAGVVFVCILLSCCKFDFTGYLIYVVVISFALGIVSMVVVLYTIIANHYIPIMFLVILVFGTIMNSIALVMELQIIIGGGRAVELNENDYAFGAYMLYTSIINIFLQLVQILGILDEM